MRMTLLGSTAVALVLALAPVHAQSQQQKGAEEKSVSSGRREEHGEGNRRAKRE